MTPGLDLLSDNRVRSAIPELEHPIRARCQIPNDEGSPLYPLPVRGPTRPVAMHQARFAPVVTTRAAVA